MNSWAFPEPFEILFDFLLVKSRKRVILRCCLISSAFIILSDSV